MVTCRASNKLKSQLFGRAVKEEAQTVHECYSGIFTTAVRKLQGLLQITWTMQRNAVSSLTFLQSKKVLFAHKAGIVQGWWELQDCINKSLTKWKQTRFVKDTTNDSTSTAPACLAMLDWFSSHKPPQKQQQKYPRATSARALSALTSSTEPVLFSCKSGNSVAHSHKPLSTHHAFLLCWSWQWKERVPENINVLSIQFIAQER